MKEKDKGKGRKETGRGNRRERKGEESAFGTSTS